MPPRRASHSAADNTFPTTSEELARMIAQAIAQHEANRADSSGGSGGLGRRRTHENEHGKVFDHYACLAIVSLVDIHDVVLSLTQNPRIRYVAAPIRHSWLVSPGVSEEPKEQLVSAAG